MAKEQGPALTGHDRLLKQLTTVPTETTGPVLIDVPRDREGTFEPRTVA